MTRIKLGSSLRELLNAGVVSPPFSIEATYKGTAVSATIDAEAGVVYQGERYSSLSVAAGIVVASFGQRASDHLPYRRVNGWTFWKFRDAAGDLRPMDDLRKGAQ